MFPTRDQRGNKLKTVYQKHRINVITTRKNHNDGGYVSNAYLRLAVQFIFHILHQMFYGKKPQNCLRQGGYVCVYVSEC